MAQFALRWIVDQAGVSVVIPGARNPEQVRGNVGAAGLAPLTEEQLAARKRDEDEDEDEE
jgi:aryl-alcohol dehydrogenase-like predicted oxidoreductase